MGWKKVDFWGRASLSVKTERRQIHREVVEAKTGLYFTELPHLMTKKGMKGEGMGHSGVQGKKGTNK